MQPALSKYEYLVGRQLKPIARTDIVFELEELGVKPTSMIDISDGLSSEVLHLCKNSTTGCRLYEDKIPIDPQTYDRAREFGLDPTVCALNGGEDYELLFTIRQEDYEKLRQQHSGSQAKLLSFEAACANAPRLKFDELARPEFTGARVLEDFSLATLREFIDWSPFFHTWELRGVYPKILQHEKHGEEARKLFVDAQKLLEEIIAKKLLRANAVYGFFPANRVGEDVELYTDASRAQKLTTLHFLRQQMEKTDGTPNWSLADFIAPNGAPDFIGGFAVSTGFGLDELVKKFKADHDDYNAIMAEALADRLAEAFAECLHKRAREEWGFGKVEKLTADNPVGRIAESIGGRITGVQVGLVLGFLSGKVLGQFEFFDRPGGQLLLGDIPNQSKRKRFFASAAGVRHHQAFTGNDEVPEVPFNVLERSKIDDAVVLGIVGRARAAGFDAYVVPQAPDLPMANRREDVLIIRP